MRLALLAFSLLTCVLPGLGIAQERVGEAKGISRKQWVATLPFETGEITVGPDLAVLKLPPEFRFLGPKGASRLLIQGWENPPSAAEGALGMILPADKDPLDPDSWGVVVTYEADGHVDDEDAASTDYDELLKSMRKGFERANKERADAGFESMNLVGWAEPPSYDSLTHKLYWAKELKFGRDESNSLNYNVKVLGRQGVLVLTAVSEMSRLDEVRASMRKVLECVEFKPGNRYADYIPGSDKAATPTVSPG